jgi:AcrR family transcriptional regulator
MPRVPDEYLEQRRRDIIEAARICFVRRGFHETSMRDVFQQAGISAGALYRYFPKKDDLIVAIAQDNLSVVADAIDDVIQAEPLPPLDQAVGRVFTALQHQDPTLDVARLALQVWGEAARSAEMAIRVANQLSSIRDAFTRLIRAYRKAGRIGAGASAETVAATFTALLPGLVLQQLMLDDVNGATLQRGVRALIGSTG